MADCLELLTAENWDGMRVASKELQMAERMDVMMADLLVDGKVALMVQRSVVEKAARSEKKLAVLTVAMRADLMADLKAELMAGQMDGQSAPQWVAVMVGMKGPPWADWLVEMKVFS